MSLEPPVARRVPSERIHHGDVFHDDYEWMRDKDDPQLLAHLEAENAYADARTDDLALLREQLFEEIKNRTRETDLSVPVRDGGWWYYTRTVEGQQYGIHCRAPIADASDWTPPSLTAGEDVPGEAVLLDDNVEAAGLDFYSLGSFDVSGDGSRLLYGVDTEGDALHRAHPRPRDGGEPARRDPGHRGRCDIRRDGRLRLLHDRRRCVAPRHRLAS
jgi:oligopeptidase B